MTPKLVDVIVQGKIKDPTIIGTFIAMPIFVAVSLYLMSRFASPLAHSIILMVGVVCGIWVALGIRHWIAHRHYRVLSKTIQQATGEPTEKQASILMTQESRWFVDVGLKVLSQSLFASGRFEQVVRIRSPRTDSVGPPINEHFEPLLLDERDVTFPIVESIDSASVEDPEKPSWRLLIDGRRWPLYVKLIWLLAWLEFGRRMMGPRGFSPYFIVLIFVIFAVSHFFQDRKQWMIVPGGIVLRTSSILGTSSRLKLLTPQDTLIVTGELNQHRWRVFAATKTETFKKECTRREADLLIRAWQSPLPPPTLEQLSDLR